MSDNIVQKYVLPEELRDSESFLATDLMQIYETNSFDFSFQSTFSNQSQFFLDDSLNFQNQVTPVIINRSNRSLSFGSGVEFYNSISNKNQNQNQLENVNQISIIPRIRPSLPPILQSPAIPPELSSNYLIPLPSNSSSNITFSSNLNFQLDEFPLSPEGTSAPDSGDSLSKFSPPLPSTSTSNAGEINPFIFKLHSALGDINYYNNVMRWSQDQSTALIDFGSPLLLEILQRLYSHKSLTAFARQLNTYGFTRLKETSILLEQLNIVTNSISDWKSFHHPLFYFDSQTLHQIRPKPSAARRKKAELTTTTTSKSS